MKRAIRTYNNIMRDIGRDECTTTEHPEWGLCDMVEEMKYNLQLWNDPDSSAYIDAHEEDQPIVNGKKQWLYNWQKEKKRMERFIARYAPQI